MGPEKPTVAKPVRCRALLLGAVLALALPWSLHAQSQDGGRKPPEPAATAPGQPPAQPAPTAPDVPTPGTQDRRVATAPPSTSLPLTPPGPPPSDQAAAPPDKPASAWVLRPVRFATPPVIDGHLDDEIWKTAAWIDDFRQLEPKEGEAATRSEERRVGKEGRS